MGAKGREYFKKKEKSIVCISTRETLNEERVLQEVPKTVTPFEAEYNGGCRGLGRSGDGGLFLGGYGVSGTYDEYLLGFCRAMSCLSLATLYRALQSSFRQ